MEKLTAKQEEILTVIKKFIAENICWFYYFCGGKNMFKQH